MKKTYLDELMSNGLIDYDKSNIDAKQYIYYPIVELFASTVTSAIVGGNEEQEKSLSLLSNSDQFDKVSQHSSTIYEKIIKNVTEIWLFSEYMRLLHYRIDTNSIQGPLADFLNNHDEFKIIDKNNNDSYQNIGNKFLEETDYSNSHKDIEEDPSTDKNQCCCDELDYRKNDSSGSIGRLTIRQFIKQYTDISSFGFDNKCGSNIASFGKISPIKSNLAKFDNKDIITKNIQDEKISNTITQSQDSSSLIACHYCDYCHNDEKEVERHSVNAHPGLPARPDPSLLGLLQQEKDTKKKEEAGNDDKVTE
ncbi:MAG TPA: hypothetical protein VLA74_14285 [Nitrososphaeraceae archaeon]|nr:hypothetical protein [Nitrososphaeraceae archaeon]